MEILYQTHSRKPEEEEKYHATKSYTEELLTQSNIVCHITPCTPETEHHIEKREFQLMKKSAIFINGSRGKTIVEQDLIDALGRSDIAAAGLDVFEQEPVASDNPLLKMKNVVTLPHI